MAWWVRSSRELTNRDTECLQTYLSVLLMLCSASSHQQLITWQPYPQMQSNSEHLHDITKVVWSLCDTSIVKVLIIMVVCNFFSSHFHSFFSVEKSWRVNQDRGVGKKNQFKIREGRHICAYLRNLMLKSSGQALERTSCFWHYYSVSPLNIKTVIWSRPTTPSPNDRSNYKVIVMLSPYWWYAIKTSAQDLNDFEADYLYPKPKYHFTE